jgi:hypothetical protein
MYVNSLIASNGRYGLVRESRFGWFVMASPDAEVSSPTFRCDDDLPEYERNDKAMQELRERLENPSRSLSCPSRIVSGDQRKPSSANLCQPVAPFADPFRSIENVPESQPEFEIRRAPSDHIENITGIFSHCRANRRTLRRQRFGTSESRGRSGSKNTGFH